MHRIEYKAVIASRGYHVYKDTTWSNAKLKEQVKVELETSKSSTDIDPYACAVKAKHSYFNGWKTVGHVPRELSRYIYFFIKEEQGTVDGVLNSLNYKPSPIPAGGLEVPLLLRFSCPNPETIEKLKGFIEDFYTYDYTGIIHEEASSDDELSDFELDIEDDETEITQEERSIEKETMEEESTEKETMEEESTEKETNENDVIILD